MKATEFKQGRKVLEGNVGRKSPTTITTQKTIYKIHDLVLTDGRITVLHSLRTEDLLGMCLCCYPQ